MMIERAFNALSFYFLRRGNKTMDHPIMMSPNEIFTMVVAICGAIVTVSAAIGVIVKAISKTKEPEIKQNERITELEQSFVVITKKMADYDSYFKKDKKRIDRLEFGNEVANEALLALISHALNGDDVDSLKTAKHKMEQYLISSGSTRDN